MISRLNHHSILNQMAPSYFLKKFKTVKMIFIMAGMISMTLGTRGQGAFQLLYEFPSSGPGPYHPSTRLLEYSDGFFYGTTSGGGTSDYGTIFKFSTSAGVTLLASFQGTNGLHPYGGLVQDDNGEFYGVTTSGGDNFPGPTFGTVFRMTPEGELVSLFSFGQTNGNSPKGPLVLGKDGCLYGTASSGGANGLGTIFRVTTNGTLTTLHSFDGTHGGNPNPGLIWGSDDCLYGTTQYGGSNFIGGLSGSGTVFRVTTNGELTVLVYFNGTNGFRPAAGLSPYLEDSFAGTTEAGGTAGFGTVFQVTTNGNLTTLYSFDGMAGISPFSEMTEGNDGNLYGTTAYSHVNSTLTNGTVYMLTTNGMLTTLAFLDGTNGLHPFTGLTLASDGYLYGAMADATADFTYNGGTLYRVAQAPKLQSVYCTNRMATLTWRSFIHGNYRVDYKASLSASEWQPLAPVTATNDVTAFTDPTEIVDRRFYRVVFLP